MTTVFVIIGGGIFVLMGCVHGLVCVVDVFRPTQFSPTDDSVRLAMKATTVRFLKADANVWDAWLGFNISHSLGMLIFGAASAYLGLNLEQIAITPSALLIPTAIAAVYLFLSVRFWFYLPAVASAASMACFFAAWLRY